MNIFRRYGLTLALLTVLVIAVYVALVAGTGNAVTYTRPPSATPARHLPTIPHSPSGVDYEVRAFTQAGSTMFAAGRFPYVVRDGVRYNAANIVGFNAITGAVTAFRVATDGEILAVTDTPAGLVIAGEFTTVNGSRHRGIAQVDRTTGRLITGFTSPFTTATRAVTYSCGRLYVGGDYDHLWTISPSTGALLTERAAIGGVYSTYSGVTRIESITVAPTCRELAIAGVFTSISNQPHRQIARLGIPLGIINWQPPALNGMCSTGAPFYARGIAYSPNSAVLDVVTSGGSSTATNICDALLRYTLPATVPNCMTKTGNDSLYSTVDTGPYIFTAGHNRWINNPQGHDIPGPGALDSPGLVGVTPSCSPIMAGSARWNPGRSRGIGAKVLYATAHGLWIGSDTREGDVLGCANPTGGIDCHARYDTTAQYGEHGHGGIGLLPAGAS